MFQLPAVLRHSVIDPTDDGHDVRRATCKEVDARLSQAESALVESNEQNDNLRRLMGNAFRIAFNAGREIANLLHTDMFGPTTAPVLAADMQSVVIEFETLTVSVAPFTERVTVAIRDTPEARSFLIPDGILSRNAQDLILGMLERSRRADKSLVDNLVLSGVSEKAAA